MVNIAKSGEEGYYPDLQKTAEERLRSLSPNNRQLRTEEPVLTRNSMNNEELNDFMSDISSWKKEISVRDLKLTEENNNTMQEITLPPIRQPPPPKCTVEKKPPECVKRSVGDYKAWDKYDADTELLKMDLEQEREREKEERQGVKKKVEVDRLELVVKEAEKLSEMERLVLAEQEKNRGNEYYQAKEFNEAIKYYKASIAIWPTAKAHNNLAACYLKQCKYSAALEAANNTLALEPNNIKALFRRGIALQHKNMFKEALADMNAILRQQPKHFLAQHISRELREQTLSLPRTIRIMHDEGFTKPKRIEEVSVDALTKDSLSGNSYEVNEWGLPKVMCQCNGSPGFLQLGPRRCPTSHYQPPVLNNARIVELSDEPKPPKASTKLEICEVENSEAVEDFFKPMKCVVVDKRTQKNISTNRDVGRNLANGMEGASGSNLSNGDCNLSVGINSERSDCVMEEDFELNCPLLEDSTEPVAEPKI